MAAGETAGWVLTKLQVPLARTPSLFASSRSTSKLSCSSRVRGTHFQLGCLLGEDQVKSSPIEAL